MPHERPRHLKALLRKTMNFSPISGILGHRQVGKTTLANQLLDNYLTLDLPDLLSQALADPVTFLSQNAKKPLIIDECQLAPPLFSALKERVRTNKKPGQFLLTGSVRFSSRAAIRESLTGRIINWELLPMDWAEQHSLPLPDTILKILDSKTLELPLTKNPTFSIQKLSRYYEVGGLPGAFGVRDPAIRFQRFETQLNTILERDLKLIIQTPLSFKTLRNCFKALAQQVGRPFSITHLARACRISLPTLRKLVPAFEALFLIRFLPSEGDYSKPILFFEDVGELNHLLPGGIQEPTLFLSFLYQNLRTQIHYRPEQKVDFFSFADRPGHLVPLCFRKGKSVLGIIPITESETLESAFQDAGAFCRHYSGAKVLIVSPEDFDDSLAKNIRRIGVSSLI